tara:strand:+ start:273 stop:503 length:231 start_codon:yes stop_codon:yes gene_type:complete
LTNKIKYILIFLILSNCNSISGTTEGLKKMSEGAGTVSEGVYKAGQGIVTITQGLGPISNGMYKDVVRFTQFLFRN